MKFQPDRINGANVIQACAERSITINGQSWRSSVLLPSQGTVQPWQWREFEALDTPLLEQLIESPEHAQVPELILIGTGSKLRFVSPRLLQLFWARRIGVETMDTAAACRTYNILVSEGRRVTAGLLLEVGESKHAPLIEGQARP